MSSALLLRTFISGYHASEEDDTGVVKYYGSLGFNGSWVIEKWDTTANPKSHRYIRGNSDYLANWDNRASLVYVIFNEAFLA